MEVYDSASTVDIFRSNSSKSFEVRKLIKARAALLARFPHARVLTFWQVSLSSPVPFAQFTDANKGVNDLTPYILCHPQDRDKGFIVSTRQQATLSLSRASAALLHSNYGVHGVQADDVSKDEMEAVRMHLQTRFPLTPLAIVRTERPPNLLNSPQAAADWTSKGEEEFHQ